MARLTRLLSLTAVLVCAICSAAFAAGPVGADPRSNFPVNQLPRSCDQPTSAACLNASVEFLNRARAGLGQGAYQLPANFDSLTAQIQQFVLTNLDRIQYGLPPITGITAGLSQDAMGGIVNDTDPHPTNPNFNYWTANWAGGFANVVLAYEAWMYDDGPGSGNLDCSSRSAAGCWGHRHDVLWSFGGTRALAMGSAAGRDSRGTSGYAMVLGGGDAGSYQPDYTYTWSQAVATGAGTGSGAVGASLDPTRARISRRHAGGRAAQVRVGHSSVRASVRVVGHRVVVRIKARAGATLRCALTPSSGGRFGSDRFHTCWATTTYPSVPSGNYRLRVRSATGLVRAYVHAR